MRGIIHLIFIGLLSLPLGSVAGDYSVSLGSGATNGVLGMQANWFVSDQSYFSGSLPLYIVGAGHAGFMDIVPTIEFGHLILEKRLSPYLEAGLAVHNNGDTIDSILVAEGGVRWQATENFVMRAGVGNYLVFYPIPSISVGLRF